MMKHINQVTKKKLDHITLSYSHLVFIHKIFTYIKKHHVVTGLDFESAVINIICSFCHQLRSWVTLSKAYNIHEPHFMGETS